MDRTSGTVGSKNRSLSVHAAASSKCEIAKWGSEIKENHDLQTLLKRTRDLTGNLNKIRMIRSIGRSTMFLFHTPLRLSLSILLSFIILHAANDSIYRDEVVLFLVLFASFFLL